MTLQWPMAAVPRRRVAWRRGSWRSLARGFGTDRDAVSRFEDAFARFVGRRHAIGVSSARRGLLLALLAAGLRRGDEVILPAYTEEGVPRMLAAGGLVPAFVDIQEADHNLDPQQIPASLTARTRAILATHLFGTPCALEPIRRLAHERGLLLVEDCAQALGVVHRGGMLGTHGQLAIFSFNRTKPFQTLGGGMVVTDDDSVAHVLRSTLRAEPVLPGRQLLRTAAETWGLHVLTSPPWFGLLLHPLLRVAGRVGTSATGLYRGSLRRPQDSYHAHARLHPAQAQLGIEALPSVLADVTARRRNAELLRCSLSPTARRRCLEVREDSGAYFFIVLAKDRAALGRAMLRRGIDTGDHVMRECASLLGHPGSFPRSRLAAEASVQVPIHSGLSAGDLRRIAAAIDDAVAAGL